MKKETNNSAMKDLVGRRCTMMSYVDESCQVLEERKILQEKSERFPFAREIRRDGNSFVRAVIYAYVERIILTKRKHLSSLADLFKGESSFFDFTLMKDLIDADVFPVLKRIADDRTSTVSGLLYYFYCAINTKPRFERTLVKAIKTTIENFAKYNNELVLNEDVIKKTAEKEYGTVADFIIEEVTRDGKEPLDIIRKIFPLVLRIQIVILFSATGNERVYPATAKKFKNVKEDCLDMHEETIYLLCKNNHYTILYEKSFYSSNDTFFGYDVGNGIIKLSCCNQETHLMPILRQFENGEGKSLFPPAENCREGLLCCPLNPTHNMTPDNVLSIVQCHMVTLFSNFCSNCGVYNQQSSKCPFSFCTEGHRICQRCNNPGLENSKCRICAYFHSPLPLLLPNPNPEPRPNPAPEAKKKAFACCGVRCLLL